jgi:hypothetical protein
MPKISIIVNGRRRSQNFIFRTTSNKSPLFWEDRGPKAPGTYGPLELVQKHIYNSEFKCIFGTSLQKLGFSLQSFG